MNLLARPWLLIALLLPAFAVPRGVELGLCFCDAPSSGCCAPDPGPALGCCGGDEEPGEGDGPQVVSHGECGCCGSLQVDDFDETVPPDGTVSVPALAAWIADAGVDLSPAVVLGRVSPPRAPPRVTPPGLRPGTAPLRL